MLSAKWAGRPFRVGVVDVHQTVSTKSMTYNTTKSVE
jgi:hypothetical protein